MGPRSQTRIWQKIQNKWRCHVTSVTCCEGSHNGETVFGKIPFESASLLLGGASQVGGIDFFRETQHVIFVLAHIINVEIHLQRYVIHL